MSTMSVGRSFHTFTTPTRPKAGREVGPLDWTQEHKSVWDGRLRATPQARARLARATAKRAGELAKACVARGDFLEVGNFAPFLYYTLRVEIFRLFCISSSLPMTPMNREKFHGNRPACFFPKSGTQTHTASAAVGVWGGGELRLACSCNCCNLLPHP